MAVRAMDFTAFAAVNFFRFFFRGTQEFNHKRGTADHKGKPPEEIPSCFFATFMVNIETNG